MTYFDDGTVDDARLIPLPSPGSAREIAWSPDGTRIAFSYQPPAGTNFDIAVMSADGIGPITFLTNDSADDHNPAWSPDGTRIAFVRGPVGGSVDRGDLYVMDADGSDQQLWVAGSQSLTASSIVHSASFSPDGTKLVYSQDTGIGNDGLFIIGAGSPGGTPALLTNSIGRDELPVWAPLVTYHLHAAKTGTGNGAVSTSAGIPCSSGVCDGDITDGTHVTLTALPDASSTFAGWSGGGCSGTGTCAVDMLDDENVTATFTASSSGGGGAAAAAVAVVVVVPSTCTSTSPRTRRVRRRSDRRSSTAPRSR